MTVAARDRFTQACTQPTRLTAAPRPAVPHPAGPAAPSSAATSPQVPHPQAKRSRPSLKSLQQRSPEEHSSPEKKKTSKKPFPGKPAKTDSLSIFLRNLEAKFSSGTELSEVEQHLHNEFSHLERSLFAPSLLQVSTSVATAFLRPGFLVALLAAAIFLPEKNSLAVLSPVTSAPGTEMLASAFVEDHPTAASGLKRATRKILEQDLSKDQEIHLPLLREMGKVDEPPAIDQAAMRSVVPEIGRVAKLAPVDKGAISTDRRSLVKFISGLIAAFRPQLPDSGLIARHIVELSGSEHVDPLYVAAVIAIESRFSSNARSGVGATGLMQLMPMTAGEVAERYNLENHAGRLTDPRANIRLGIRYLKELEQRYNGNRFLALSAYNWGPGNVDQARGRERNIPGSVKKYSKTILERTSNWRKHFARANESADLLAEVAQPPTHS